MNMSERMKKARAEAGMTQLELAKAIGVSKAAVGMLESRNTNQMRGVTACMAAKAMNVRVEWLVMGEEPMRRPPTEIDPVALAECLERAESFGKMPTAKKAHLVALLYGYRTRGESLDLALEVARLMTPS